MNMEDILIFVDGELYSGEFALDEHNILKLDKSLVARYQDVVLLYLNSMVLNYCVYNNKNQSLYEQLKNIVNYFDVLTFQQKKYY